MSTLNTNDLVKNIEDIFGDTLQIAVTKKSFLHPTPEWVQKLVFGFLQEFEHSSGFMTQNHSCIELELGNLSNEITDNLPLDILVVAARKFFQRIQYREITFGLMDVVDPDPKRIKKFLGQMVNFWLFCNDQYETAEQRQKEVMSKVTQAKNLAKEKNHNLKEIEDLRQNTQTVQIQKTKIDEDIQSVENNLEELLKLNQVLTEKQATNKAELAELKKTEEKMNENNEKFEKEKKRLQMLVKSDEMKQELETQLAGLGEESDSKQLKAHECKVKIQELKTRLVHFQKHSRELQALTEKHEHIKKAREDIEQLKLEDEEKKHALLRLDEELLISLQRFDEVKKDCATRANTWNKKMSCLEAEIKDYEDEIKKIRQGMSEEDIAASDLESNIENAKQTNDKIKKETELECVQVREEFAKLMNSYKVFEAKMENELKMCNAAFSELDRGRM